MSARFEIIRTLEENSASTLSLVRIKKRNEECCLRRFKTQKPEEIAGLQELFTQLSPLENPHLPHVIDFGTDKEGFFLLQEPVPGESIEKVLERGPLTVAEFEAVARQLLEVLEALHELAIVHGSLRPDFVRIAGKNAADWNIMLDGFGQGFSTEDDTKEAQIRAYRCTAPEQWLDGTTRRRTDVYALGCIFYEALTARPPFDARALKELRLKHLNHDLPPLQKLAPHVPAWICAWVTSLMAADPEQRPRKAAVAREQFEKREAPGQPAAPAQEPPPSSAPAVPQQTAAASVMAPPVSAPVILPTRQSSIRHATSSTIPIAAGPHVAARSTAPPRKPGTSQIKRRAITPARPASPFSGGNKTPILIAAAAILLMLAVFIVPRCGISPTPTPAKPPAKKQPSSANAKPPAKKGPATKK